MYRYTWKMGTMITSFSIFIASPVEACTISLSPEEKIEMGYRQGIISAVAAVTILDSNYVHGAMFRMDAQPWRAMASVDTLLFGSYAEKVVSFQRGLGSAACDDGRGLARPGEKWIVYFWRHPERGQLIWITYPIDVALASDPVLGSIMMASTASNGVSK